MQRTLKGGMGRPDFDPELGGAESALTKLAAKLVHPDGAQVWGSKKETEGGGGASGRGGFAATGMQRQKTLVKHGIEPKLWDMLYAGGGRSGVCFAN